MNKTILATDNADLIAFHAVRIRQAPSLYYDTLTHRVVADVSQESRNAFYNDEPLQRFLSVKIAIWRTINILRESKR
jgi:hypothetical protein